MKKVIALLKEPRPYGYGFLLSNFVVIVSTGLIGYFVGTLRLISVFIGVMLVTYLLVKALEQSREDKKYSTMVHTILSELENDIPKGIESLQQFISTQKETLEHLKTFKDREFTRYIIFYVQGLQVKNLEYKIANLTEAEKLLKKI